MLRRPGAGEADDTGKLRLVSLLKKQRDDHRGPGTSIAPPRCHLGTPDGPNPRVQDRLQPLPGPGVAKHDLREPRPPQRPGFIKHPLPNAATTAARPSDPGAVQVRAIASVSTQGTPSASRIPRETDLPIPIPPVTPRRIMKPNRRRGRPALADLRADNHPVALGGRPWIHRFLQDHPLNVRGIVLNRLHHGPVPARQVRVDCTS